MTWQKAEEISLELLKGLDLHGVYENIIKSLLSVSKESVVNLEQTIEKQKAADRLNREIVVLEAKIHKELQFNRKVEYNLKMQEKRRELEKLLNNGKFCKQ